MKDQFRRTFSEGFKVDIPKLKNQEGKRVFSIDAIDWHKVISRLWFPALTFIAYVIENDLGYKAAILLAIRTILDYGWAAGIDIRHPSAKSKSGSLNEPQPEIDRQ